MKEFGITYTKGLLVGLRPYPTNKYGDELLVECYNLRPFEDGLTSHEELIEFNFIDEFPTVFPPPIPSGGGGPG